MGVCCCALSDAAADEDADEANCGRRALCSGLGARGLFSPATLDTLVLMGLGCASNDRGLTWSFGLNSGCVP
eukprot:3933570-Prymnesium_polylepis.2